jgi:hypothetical protein
MFVRLAAGAVVAAVAIAAGSGIEVDRGVFAFDSCPFVATGGDALLFDAASLAPLRSDSGFECPINRLLPSS